MIRKSKQHRSDSGKTSRLTRSRTARLAAVGASVLLLTSACGSDSGSSDASGKTLKIGLSNSTSGPLAVYGAIGDGMKVFFESLNEKGGVGGYKFEVVEVDNKGTGPGGATAVRQLLNQDPFALSIVTTAAFKGSTEILRSLGKDTPVLVGASGGAIEDSELPTAYGLYTNYTTDSLYAADYLLDELGKTELATVFDPVSGTESGAVVPKHIEESGGTDAATISIPSTTTNFSPIVTKLESSGATGVVATRPITRLAGLTAAAKRAGLDIPIVSYSGAFDESLLELGGKDIDGLYVPSFMPPTSSDEPALEPFKADMAKYSSPDKATFQTAVGWNGGAIIAEAVKRILDDGDELNAKNFQAVLNSLDGEQVGLATLGYTEDAHAAVTEDLTMHQVIGGEFKAVP
jgi:branched-chain amino acid transport system substrate-binding protein